MRKRVRDWLAILIVGLGAGTSAAIVTAHRQLHSDILPYYESDRLVTVPGAWITYTQEQPSVEGWLSEAGEFEDIGLYQPGAVTVTSDTGVRRVAAAAVGLQFFDVLRQRPQWGRLLTAGDAGMRHAVVAEGLARTILGDGLAGPPLVRIDGTAFQVVGTIADRFSFPSGAQIWVPFGTGSDLTQGRGRAQVVARLSNGTSIRDARNRITASGAPRYGQPFVTAEAVRSFRDEVSRGALPLLRMLQWLCGVLLAVTCTTMWSLGVVQSTTARQDLAIRIAVGATRWHLVRAIARQAGVIVIGAAVVGVLVSSAALWVLGAAAVHVAPNLELRASDPRLIAVSLAGAALAGAALIVGQFVVVVRLDKGRASITSDLRSAGAGGLRRAMIVLQIALAVVLLTAAMASTEMIARAAFVDSGFGRADAVSVELPLSRERHGSASELKRLADEITNRLQTRFPRGHVGLSDTSTGEAGLTVWPLVREGTEQGANVNAIPISVSEGYAAAVGIPLLAGRWFNYGDVANPRSSVVLSASAIKGLGLRVDEVVGTRVEHFDSGATVVGVVGDTRLLGPHNDPVPVVYRPLGELFRVRALTVVVADSGITVPSVVEALQGIDPDIAIVDPRLVGDYMSPFLAVPRLVQRMAAATSGVAVVLAAMAIYGLLSHDLASRRRDIAIRLALGESRSSVARRYHLTVVSMCALGLVIGCAVSMYAWPIAEAAVHGLPRPSNLAWLSSGTVMMGAAFLAAWRPVSQAAAVNPAALFK